MLQIVLHNFLRFVFLILLQVLVCDNIQVLGFVTPYVYVLFILSLPNKTSRSLTLLLAFFVGLLIDVFSNTLGLHAFATVLMAFLRTPLLKKVSLNEDNFIFEPNFRTLGFSHYLQYVILLVVIHHFTLFFLESFSIIDFEQILYRSLLNSLVTIVLILGIQLLRIKR